MIDALGLEHRLRSSYEKSIMERANQYLKDRVEEFDDYHPCAKEGCDLSPVRNWLSLFLDMQYAKRRRIRFRELTRFLGGERP